MRTCIRGNAGMTFVEALVAGVISAVIGGVIIVMYRIYSDQTRESSALLSLQNAYSAVMEQIAVGTHNAYMVIPADESFTDACGEAAATAAGVIFYDKTGVPYGGIGISNDTIIECDATLNWIPLTSGFGPVLVDSDSTRFELNRCRNSITVFMRLKRSTADTTFYLGPVRETFVCRN